MSLHRRVPVGPALAWALLVALAGCDSLSGLTGGSKSLAVKKFVASPSEILAGSVAILTWDVVGAESVEIDNGIGKVGAKGSKQVKPEQSTTYSLSAKSGSSTADASLRVAVRTDPGDPKPSPTPTPTPSPTPTPGPTPTPSPSPTPTPTPAPTSCGDPVTSASGCAILITKPVPLPGDQCIEIVAVTLSIPCPVGDGTSLDLGFKVKAKTAADSLTWHRSTDSFDALYPSSGAIASDGISSVSLTDVVLADRVTVEVVDVGGRVRLRLTVRHR